MVISTSLFSTVLVGRLAKNCAKCILATTKIGPFSVAQFWHRYRPLCRGRRIRRQSSSLSFRFLGNLPNLRANTTIVVNANRLTCVINQAFPSHILTHLWYRLPIDIRYVMLRPIGDFFQWMYSVTLCHQLWRWRSRSSSPEISINQWHLEWYFIIILH